MPNLYLVVSNRSWSHCISHTTLGSQRNEGLCCHSDRQGLAFKASHGAPQHLVKWNASRQFVERRKAQEGPQPGGQVVRGWRRAALQHTSPHRRSQTNNQMVLRPQIRVYQHNSQLEVIDKAHQRQQPCRACRPLRRNSCLCEWIGAIPCPLRLRQPAFKASPRELLQASGNSRVFPCVVSPGHWSCDQCPGHPDQEAE